MTCYACGRQPGDVCRREDGCTAHDAPFHSSPASAPDFEALRAKRNASVRAMVEKICAEQGWSVDEVTCSHNNDACYCDCANGGPCEHKFDGWHDFKDGSGGTAVCSRCGATAMGHDMRTMP